MTLSCASLINTGAITTEPPGGFGNPIKMFTLTNPGLNILLGTLCFHLQTFDAYSETVDTPQRNSKWFMFSATQRHGNTVFWTFPWCSSPGPRSRRRQNFLCRYHLHSEGNCLTNKPGKSREEWTLKRIYFSRELWEQNVFLWTTRWCTEQCYLLPFWQCSAGTCSGYWLLNEAALQTGKHKGKKRKSKLLFLPLLLSIPPSALGRASQGCSQAK